MLCRSSGSERVHAACTETNQAERKGLPWEDATGSGGLFVKPWCFVLYYLDTRSCISSYLTKAGSSDRGKKPFHFSAHDKQEGLAGPPQRSGSVRPISLHIRETAVLVQRQPLVFTSHITLRLLCSGLYLPAFVMAPWAPQVDN